MAALFGSKEERFSVGSGEWEKFKEEREVEKQGKVLVQE
jgi:hypothetical protein